MCIRFTTQVVSLFLRSQKTSSFPDGVLNSCKNTLVQCLVVGEMSTIYAPNSANCFAGKEIQKAQKLQTCSPVSKVTVMLRSSPSCTEACRLSSNRRAALHQAEKFCRKYGSTSTTVCSYIRIKWKQADLHSVHQLSSQSSTLLNRKADIGKM